jgi:hypothetical protein
MLNFFKTLLSFFMGTIQAPQIMSESYEKILDHAFDRMSEIFCTLAYGFSGIVLMLIGFLTSYFNVLYLYDKEGRLSVGAVAIGGITLFIIGYLFLYNSPQKPTSSKEKKNPVPPTPVISPLEVAIADVIQDFLSERQRARELARELERDLTKEKEFKEKAKSPEAKSEEALH